MQAQQSLTDNQKSGVGLDGPINLALNNTDGRIDHTGLGGPLMDDGLEQPMESGRVCRICLDEEEDL